MKREHLSFIYSDGLTTVDPDRQPPDIAVFFQALRTMFVHTTDSIDCPSFGKEAYATIMIHVSKTTAEWEFTESCCPLFEEAILEAIPHRWRSAERKRPPRPS